MSRNASGTYTLPSGNPVVSGTLIEATWANDTLSDLASAMTDSLSRSGQGGMTAALRLYDGTSSVPGLAWGSETTTGWYRAGAGDMRLVVTGSTVMQYLSTGVAITGTLSASGNTTVGGTLGVTGATTLTGALTINGGIANNPTITAGTANGVAYLNGSKVLTTGSALTFDGTNLGVGTSTPVFSNSGQGIMVNGTTAGTVRVTQNGGTQAGEFRADANNVTIGSRTNGPLVFEQFGSEQMRLTSTGLGIGTSSPGYKLDVRGVTASGNGTITTGFSYDTGGLVGTFSNHALGILTNGAVVAKFDTSGNLGLGVTPSAWRSSADRTIQVRGAAFSGYNNYSASITNNAYLNASSSWTYIESGVNPNKFGLDNGGGFSWNIAPSGTAGNAISFTQAMTLDASGNLGVGVTSIQRRLHLGGGANDAGIKLSTDTSGNGNLDGADITFTTTNTLFITNRENGATVFENNGSERARIDSSGNLLVGTTSTISAGKISLSFAGATQNGIVLQTTLASTGSDYMQFFNSAGSVAGRITQNGTTTVAYTTSSDYRLKENVQPMTGALAKVASLKPVTYKWKVDGSAGEGFIAHELQEVVPQCVTGEKDAVDAEGNPQYQGIDTSFLVATLTAAIQEQQAIINQLKARLDAANL